MSLNKLNPHHAGGRNPSSNKLYCHCRTGGSNAFWQAQPCCANMHQKDLFLFKHNLRLNNNSLEQYQQTQCGNFMSAGYG